MSFLAKEFMKVAKSELKERFTEKKPDKTKGNTSETAMYPNYNQPYNQGGYNQQQSQYPNQSSQGGYPPSSNTPYPPSSGYGFNQPQGNGNQIGFVASGNPSSAPGYPSGNACPSSGSGYLFSNPGYPSSNTGYPQSGQGYPPSSSYPSNPGYPGQNNPSQNTVYPSNQHYPSSNAYPNYQQPPGAYQSYQPSGAHQTYASDSVHITYPAPHNSSAPIMYSNPSIRADPNANPQHDAETLRKAMKGLGCNKDKVIQVLCARSSAQRQQIGLAFKQLYGKDLINELKSELSGDFENLILALMENPVKYDADQLHKAMAGIGTRESVLIEIMTTRNNAQIHQLRQVYQQVYGKDLEKDLIGETSGHFKRLLVSLCTGARDESNQTDPLRANQDARKLYKAGEQRLGTDESCFNAILASQNFAQLRIVFDEYQKTCGHSIEQAIASEFSGDIKDGLEAVIKSIRNRPGYFAELLYNSMKGLGTRDGDLIRIIVTRSEIDLADIRNEYQRIYGKSLESAISGDCSGSYKEGLIALVKGN
ncbi:unnamed protein product [Bursaphelenchus okinawaensis]|uniref:Annexin n=1 Tax=Bursaphelenchus okinawaensis TaxID=465554 RepID=A0A811KJW0_9BILA|nr:unnamed protein product [Bursaphelenchus okinawaensis]CAG9103988.1 unnamed protein product [Bursaphelenchus okinawaensis]